MKICPICNQTYVDDNLNYCLNDGGTLTSYKDDAPPTVMFERARTTQQNWENPQPTPSWGSQPLQQHQTQSPASQNQPFYPPPVQGQNQTLPTVALALGIFSLLFGCCYGGIPLGAAALIVGFLGMRNINENPVEFSGRGLAIGGIVTGLIGLLFSLGLFLLVIISG